MKFSSLPLKILRKLKHIATPPLRNYRAYQELFKDKDGIEIGGPSPFFRKELPIYKIIKSLDGVNFGFETIWEGKITTGKTYNYFGKKSGNQFIYDATDLSEIGSNHYDFLLSCNNLEHVANPLKALKEWTRIIKPGGYLLLILPKKESNFDHRREVTEFKHLLNDYSTNVSEKDLTHLDEILRLHDLTLDIPAGDFENFKKRSNNNFENRCLHHHVFNMELIEKIFEHLNLQLVLKSTIPTDFVSAARKPLNISGPNN